MAVTCVACDAGKAATRETTAIPSTAGPLHTTAPTTTAPPAEDTDLRVYFLRGDAIDVAHRAVPATRLVAAAAVAQLLAGPSTADRVHGFTTAIPAGTRLRGVTIADGTATIDLSGEFSQGAGPLTTAARVAQVTYTLTQFQSIGQVAFLIEGKPLMVFDQQGAVFDHPATRAAFETLASPILVEFPGRDSTVRSPMRVRGSANVFEGQFRVELTDPAGRVIAAGPVHATAGTGSRGTFDVTVPYRLATSGTGMLTVFDASAKDGARIDVVQIPLQLSAS